MKTLKFNEELVELILSGAKTVTWRINDEKNILVGDMVSMLGRPALDEFAKAQVVSVIEKPFSELTEKDFEGHEKFSSEKEMYENYTKMYGQEIRPETKVKIIKFELINSLS